MAPSAVTASANHGRRVRAVALGLLLAVMMTALPHTAQAFVPPAPLQAAAPASSGAARPRAGVTTFPNGPAGGPEAPATVAVAAKGFGFGRKKNEDASEGDDAAAKYWQGIYAPFGEKRWPKPAEPCACGSGLAYEQCCFPLHAGTQVAATPEALLRSRYTAYYHGFPQYLFKTTHPTSSPRKKKSREKAYLELLEIACSEETLRQLQIGEQEPGEDKNEAFITFRVKRHVWMSERSRFLKEGEGWLFFDEQV